MTVYNESDKYLICNNKNRYNASYYSSIRNPDGTVIVRINPKGEGGNAVPSSGKNWCYILRVCELNGDIEFPGFLTWFISFGIS